MKKIFVLVLSLLVFGVHNVCVNYAPDNITLIEAQWLVDGFCSESCQDWIMQRCPFPILVPNSRDEHCGFKDGLWRNYTFTCEACMNDLAESFYRGFCTCALIDCPEGFVCIGGNCY